MVVLRRAVERKKDACGENGCSWRISKPVSGHLHGSLDVISVYPYYIIGP